WAFNPDARRDLLSTRSSMSCAYSKTLAAFKLPGLAPGFRRNISVASETYSPDTPAITSFLIFMLVNHSLHVLRVVPSADCHLLFPLLIPLPLCFATGGPDPELQSEILRRW